MFTLIQSLRAKFGQSVSRGKPNTAPLHLDLSKFDVIYAIGDVHGCLDLMLSLETKIAKDINNSHFDLPVILYLGDLVDRGPKSAHILDHLTQRSTKVPRLSLRGNHEQLFMEFLQAPKNSLDWLDFGGAETLNSYGIYKSRSFFEKASERDIMNLLFATIPDTHINFMNKMPHFADWDNKLFCHAGVDPTRPLSDQTAEDYMWARDRFLAHDRGYERVIVHGHTPCTKPEIAFGRISIDTEAYKSGTLTSARITATGEDITFLSSN
jgi:serine/threonine protein phosphatase 1